jgi:CTP:phosphocholine cytidylyltransferase-like protein
MYETSIKIILFVYGCNDFSQIINVTKSLQEAFDFLSEKIGQNIEGNKNFKSYKGDLIRFYLPASICDSLFELINKEKYLEYKNKGSIYGAKIHITKIELLQPKIKLIDNENKKQKEEPEYEYEEEQEEERLLQYGKTVKTKDGQIFYNYPFYGINLN